MSCKTCEERRKKLASALSQRDAVEAARQMMLGVGELVANIISPAPSRVGVNRQCPSCGYTHSSIRFTCYKCGVSLGNSVD